MVNTRPLYYAMLVALLAERGFELALSRRNLRRVRARGGVESGRRHFPVMALVHGLFAPACALEVALARRRVPGPLGAVALAGALAAQALRYWAILTLRDRWNVRVVVEPGAAPVTRGPYRWVRHPNYAAVGLEMICVPLVHGAWATAITFASANAALLAVRLDAEERALGQPWEDAFAGKPRFVPGVPP